MGYFWQYSSSACFSNKRVGGKHFGCHTSGRRAIRENHSPKATNSPRRNQQTALAQAKQRASFLTSRRQPQNPPASIDDGICQCHSAPSLVVAVHTTIRAGVLKDRTSGTKEPVCSTRPKT